MRNFAKKLFDFIYLFDIVCVTNPYTQLHAFLFISNAFISNAGWDFGHIWELFSKILIFWRIFLHRKIALIPNSILNIHLKGMVGKKMEKVDLKLSNRQPQLKFADAYKKKACTRFYFLLAPVTLSWGSVVLIFELIFRNV